MKALMVIDVQQGMFADPAHPPFEGLQVVAKIADLIAQARRVGAPVVYVQHDGGQGHPLTPGAPGYPFHVELTPRDGDVVVVKNHCSAFQGTDLEGLLKARGITDLVVTGMQSDYCVDTTVRSAFERGFKVLLVQDGHTTFDQGELTGAQIRRHHNRLLDHDFARLAKAQDVIFEAFGSG
jgi:nicotinamidase-related amidase